VPIKYFKGIEVQFKEQMEDTPEHHESMQKLQKEIIYWKSINDTIDKKDEYVTYSWDCMRSKAKYCVSAEIRNQYSSGSDSD
jgi:hypothetical protein